MDNQITLISECINKCLLPKLAKEYYQNDFHPEYEARNSKLRKYFPELKSLLENVDLMQKSKTASSILSYLLILYIELQTRGPWNTHKIHIGYCHDIEQIFTNKYEIQLHTVLEDGSFDCQAIFEKCIQELHKKITIDDFKKYPGFIEIYWLLVGDVMRYSVKLNPVTVLPAALLLIDDYVTANKIKGLECCIAVLQCLTTEDFTAGNYYEVVYSSLKKNMVEKDKEVTQALFQCIMEFIKLVPPNIRKIKLDDIYSNVVDQLHTESNLYRKADCFSFITKVIEMHGIHCVKKKLFKDIICDNIDICSNESVSEILLLNVLECLQMWIRYYWCVWRFSSDNKMLSSLFKMLYLTKDETMILKIQNLIITLIKLCSKKDQMLLLENLNNPPKCFNEDFLRRLSTIKKAVNN